MPQIYLHTNCLAVLFNVAAASQNMHPYAAHRMVALIELLSRRRNHILKVAHVGGLVRVSHPDC